MGLSETIVAAIIGAIATMMTALVHIYRYRAMTGDNRPNPKKNRARSTLATIALMIGCIVGGYAWSALRAVSAKEELRATMQEEFTRQFTEFAARQSRPATPAAEPALPVTSAALAVNSRNPGAAESVVQLPPCRIESHPDEVGPVTCTERDALPVALCATIPATAQAGNIRVQARVPGDAEWEERDPGAAALGALRIASTTTDQAVDAELRLVCLDVANWSVETSLVARLIVEYSFAKAPPAELTAATPAQAF